MLDGALDLSTNLLPILAPTIPKNTQAAYLIDNEFRIYRSLKALKPLLAMILLKARGED